MPFTLQIREKALLCHENPARTSTGNAQWETEMIAAGSGQANVRIRDPASLAASQPLPGLEPEPTIAWYLENHFKEPFETTKSEIAAELLAQYGRSLASQVASSGLLPRSGHVHLQVITPVRTSKSPELLGPPLQRLHWEVLEDVGLWPSGFRLDSVSVVRSVTQIDTAAPENRGTADVTGRTEGFKILLVVSRPRPADVEYQLVAKYLVGIVDYVSETSPSLKPSLTILRPPTWEAFRYHLGKSKYDLVHLDMTGKIRTNDTGDAEAVLEFCKPSPSEPLNTIGDMKTGEEVGSELARAGVRTVMLNACHSASFRDSAPASNLAEVLLRHGVHSVLAMAYKVVESAVEIFTGAFYHSLLVEGASVQGATHVGRSALLRNKQRRAWCMHSVQLADYIVPVLYTSVLDDAVPAPGRNIFADAVDRILASIKRVSRANWTPWNASVGVVPQVLRGRDYNLLSLEARLSLSQLVLIHGQGGVGKSELLRYACGWWRLSGWITAAAYIDFGEQRTYSMQSIIESIANQLDLDPGKRSEKEIIRKLRARSGPRYLVVFDSAEVFDTPIERVSCSAGLPEQLRDFVRAATSGQGLVGSMVIVASRLDTTSIVDVPSARQKYRLRGLSDLDSVELLRELAFEPGREVPQGFFRRENIDALRRAAILVEGNPEAIRLLVPELQRTNYTGEALIETLLYGVCTAISERPVLPHSRFTQSLWFFLDSETTTGIGISSFAPFWNVMPRDLTVYYWFSYLDLADNVPAGTVHNWESVKFREMVAKSTMGRILRESWPKMEAKLIQAGFLSHAIITRTNGGGTVPCYHVHPVCTLHARATLKPRLWAKYRAAYVRQSIIWHTNPSWAHIAWDGLRQHDDHAHNWRAVAMAWALQDGDPREEADRAGATVFDLVYVRVATYTANTHPRQARVLVPHLRAYLLQLHMLVDLVRPAGVPTMLDARGILMHSSTLWTLETEVMKTPAAERLARVEAALEAVDRWKKGGGDSGALAGGDLISLHELLHAAGEAAAHLGDVPRAKSLYERHLATEEGIASPGALADIRQCYLKSLQSWSTCVIMLGMGEQDYANPRALAEKVRGSFREALGDTEDWNQWFGGGSLGETLRFVGKALGGGESGFEEMATMPLRIQFAYALEREPGAVEGFSSSVKRMLERPAWGMVQDALGGQQPVFGRGRDTAEGGGAGEVKRVMEYMMQRLAVVEEEPKPGDRPDPELEKLRDAYSWVQSSMRVLAGDPTGAAAALQARMAREALSSTTGTGWQVLAEQHLFSYELAVRMADQPDYKKGLSHLEEWWKLHEGRDVPKMDRCKGLIRFATCYHALDQLAAAAKSVIKLVELGHSLSPADCNAGGVEAAHVFLNKSIAKLDKLHVFLEPRSRMFAPPCMETLNWGELQMIHRTVTAAVKMMGGKARCEQSVRQLQQLLHDFEDLRATLPK